MSQFLVDIEYQELFLAECLANPVHCELAKSSVKPENFSDRCLQWYYSALTKGEPLSKVTLKEELAKAIQAKIIRKEDSARFFEVFKKVINKPLPTESKHLQDTLSLFIRTQNTKRAILDSMDAIQDGRWEEILAKVTDAVNSGVDVLARGQDYLAQLEERLDRRKLLGDTVKFPTGIPDLDEVLTGGIENKQVAMFVGGSGRGKSNTLVWLARQALILGKNVVYFTFEISEDKIAERMDSMVARVKPAELKDKTDEVRQKVELFGRRYAGGKLIIKEFPPDSTTVPQLGAFLKQLANVGFPPDVVLVDYLDLIKPHRIYGDVNIETDAVCKALCGLAKEFDTRVITASQLNRAGMVAENPDESSLAGSISKIYNTDVVIYLAQSKDQRELEEMRLLVIKNRNGPAGRSIDIETDYSYMTFYRAMKKADSLLPPEDNTNESE